MISRHGTMRTNTQMALVLMFHGGPSHPEPQGQKKVWGGFVACRTLTIATVAVTTRLIIRPGMITVREVWIVGEGM